MTLPLLDRYRPLANNALERWIPRTCTKEWLTEISGPTRFQWDVRAIQIGFTEPLHECAAAIPERLRPALSAAVIEAAGLDPTQYLSLLAALELQFLSGMMVKDFHNGKTVAKATPDDARRPLSVIATAAYTASQFAPVLASRHTASLQTEDRAWLAYRFGRVLVLAGVGAAVNHIRWRREHQLMTDKSYVEHLRGYVCPLFELCIDCTVAALGVRGRPEFIALQRAAASAGLAYQLALEAENWNGDLYSGGPGLKAEPSYLTMAAVQSGDANSLSRSEPQQFLQIARRERLAVEPAMELVPAEIRDIFLTFLTEVVDPLLTKTAEATHAH